jgi:sugar (pentulose or hexulose) kinase
MGSGFSRTYTPNDANAKVYDELYKKYQKLGQTLEQQLRGL